MEETTEKKPVRRKISRRDFLKCATAAGLTALAGVRGSVPPRETGTASGEAASERALADWTSQIQALRRKGKIDIQGKLGSSIIAATLEDINRRFPSPGEKEALYEEVTRRAGSGPCEGNAVNNGSVGVIVEYFLLGVSLESQRRGQEIDPRNVELYDTSEATADRLVHLLGRVDTPKRMRVVEKPSGCRRIIATLELFMPSPDTGGAIFGQAIKTGIQAVTQEPEPEPSG